MSRAGLPHGASVQSALGGGGGSVEARQEVAARERAVRNEGTKGRVGDMPQLRASESALPEGLSLGPAEHPQEADHLGDRRGAPVFCARFPPTSEIRAGVAEVTTCDRS